MHIIVIELPLKLIDYHHRSDSSTRNGLQYSGSIEQFLTSLSTYQPIQCYIILMQKYQISYITEDPF